MTQWHVGTLAIFQARLTCSEVTLAGYIRCDASLIIRALPPINYSLERVSSSNCQDLRPTTLPLDK